MATKKPVNPNIHYLPYTPPPKGQITDPKYIDTAAFEAWASKKYIDSRGYPTIGFGHQITGANDPVLKKLGIDPNGTLTEQQAKDLFAEDQKTNLEGVKKAIPNYDKLSPVGQALVRDIAFNAGWQGLAADAPKGPHNHSALGKALNNGDYATAGKILNSWPTYHQNKQRYQTIMQGLQNEPNGFSKTSTTSSGQVVSTPVPGNRPIEVAAPSNPANPIKPAPGVVAPHSIGGGVVSNLDTVTQQVTSTPKTESTAAPISTPPTPSTAKPITGTVISPTAQPLTSVPITSTVAPKQPAAAPTTTNLYTAQSTPNVSGKVNISAGKVDAIPNWQDASSQAAKSFLRNNPGLAAQATQQPAPQTTGSDLYIPTAAQLAPKESYTSPTGAIQVGKGTTSIGSGVPLTSHPVGADAHSLGGEMSAFVVPELGNQVGSGVTAAPVVRPANAPNLKAGG